MTTRLTRLVARRSDLIVGGVFWALVTAVVAPAIRTPPHVDRLVVDNPYPWHADVTITDADRDGWVSLGTAVRDKERTFTDVADQGDIWTVRFAYARQHVEIRVDRTRLEHDDWRITVPDDLASRLRAANVAETPL